MTFFLSARLAQRSVFVLFLMYNVRYSFRFINVHYPGKKPGIAHHFKVVARFVVLEVHHF